jgi:hypothetical protein
MWCRRKKHDGWWVTQRTSISDQVKKITATGHLRLEPCAKHCVLPFFPKPSTTTKRKEQILNLKACLHVRHGASFVPAQRAGRAGQMCAPARLHGMDRGLGYTLPLPAWHAHRPQLCPRALQLCRVLWLSDSICCDTKTTADRINKIYSVPRNRSPLPDGDHGDWSTRARETGRIRLHDHNSIGCHIGENI